MTSFTFYYAPLLTFTYPPGEQLAAHGVLDILCTLASTDVLTSVLLQKLVAVLDASFDNILNIERFLGWTKGVELDVSNGDDLVEADHKITSGVASGYQQLLSLLFVSRPARVVVAISRLLRKAQLYAVFECLCIMHFLY